MADEWELLHRRCLGLTRAVGDSLHILRETLKSQKLVIVVQQKGDRSFDYAIDARQRRNQLSSL